MFRFFRLAQIMVLSVFFAPHSAAANMSAKQLNDALVAYFAAVAEAGEPGAGGFKPHPEFYLFTQNIYGRSESHYRPLLEDVFCAEPEGDTIKCRVAYQWRGSGVTGPQGPNFNRQFATTRVVMKFAAAADGVWRVAETCQIGGIVCSSPLAASEEFTNDVLSRRVYPLTYDFVDLPDVAHLNYDAFEIVTNGEGLDRTEYLRVISDDVGFAFEGQGLRAGQVFNEGNGRTEPPMGKAYDPLDLLRMLATLPPTKEAWMKGPNGSDVRLRHVSLREAAQKQRAEQLAREEQQRINAARARAGDSPAGIPPGCRFEVTMKVPTIGAEVKYDALHTFADSCAKLVYVPRGASGAVLQFSDLYRLWKYDIRRY